MRITREDLYKRIWSEPATALARRYDVSSSYLARVCEGLNVPHPPRGYWARKAAGEKIAIPPLPPASPGDPVEWVRGLAVAERLPPLESPAPSKSKAGRAPRPTSHPLVAAWRSYLDEASPTESDYLAPRKKNLLDAFVTKAMIRAAADALNALFIELELRGHRVLLSADYSHNRPPVDVAQRAIKDQYARRPNAWQPARPTVAHVHGAVIGLTLFELTEHVRVRQTGADRYVRITDLAPVRRYAPQSPDETDLTRDMPTGRFVLRAYSTLYDTAWQHEWTESSSGEFVTLGKAIADFLEEIAPALVKQAEEAQQRQRERQARAEEESRRHEARERAKARQQARQAAKEELRGIVKAWNDAFAVEAFFTELSRRAATLKGAARANLETRICTARALMGGQDAVERFLSWTSPAEMESEDEAEPDNEFEDD